MVKIIKRFTVLFVFLLTVSNVVGQTSVEVDLLLHTRQGEIKNYPLKNHTVITYSDGNLIMTTKDGAEKYPHSSVHKFTFSTKAAVVNPSSVTLDKTTAELVEGETLTLTATVKPDDATDKTVTWTSSDETVATVKDGVVSAKKAGKTTVIATCGSQSATCEITVKAKVIAAGSITLDKTTAELIEGETLTLTATVKPDDTTDKTVTWTSSDKTVATVKDGVVSAKKAGKTTVIATCGSQSATCEITVKAKVVAAGSITLDKTTADLIEGETLTLTATVKPDDTTDKTVTWTSSDETVATVKDGVVFAKKAGKTTVIATCGSQSATCEITVKAKVIAAGSITLDKTTAELIEGETLTLTATVKPDDATDKTVTWTSSDESVAKVINGVVIAVKAGKATIIATCGSQSATCEITVKAKVIAAGSITLDKTTAELIEGETLTLTATVKPDDTTDKTVTWTSSDESVAKVINGVVIAVKAGKATIIATCGSQSATCEIIVKAKTIAAGSITLDKTSAEMMEGEILTLTATVKPDDATDKTVTWTSSDETVATVKDGQVTAIKSGKATITVTSTSNPSVIATCDVTVVSATGIAAIMAADGTVRADIYSTTGVLVRRAGDSLIGLKPGIYIVNGKKTVVK